MPSNINELIEGYVETRHVESNIQHNNALQEILLYRMGIESSKNPLNSDVRFSALKVLSESNRDTIQPIDSVLIEECKKIVRLHNLSDTILYGTRITDKVNAFAQKLEDCQMKGKPFVLKLDMNKLANLDDTAFKSLMYCLQQFQPNLDISHLFAKEDNIRQDQFIHALPEGLDLSIHGIKAHTLLLERTTLLFTLIAKARALSLTHSELGLWTTQDIQVFRDTLIQNQYLQSLDIRYNDLYRWAAPRHSEKLQALATLIKKTGLKDVNIEHNGLEHLTKEERQLMRSVISEALEGGLCQIHAPRKLVSPGCLGFFKYIFSHPGRGNCPEQEIDEQNTLVAEPN